MTLSALVAALKRRYGKPDAPAVTDPWKLLLLENVVYLADDAKRLEALADLEREIGLDPREILAASPARLAGIARGRGILATRAAEKVRAAATIASERWDGDLGPLRELPVSEAIKELRRFPGIGIPGAERILLLARIHPFLALESNGLRVLVRMGFGEEAKSYAATYRSVRDALEGRHPRDYGWLIEAHQLLRRHGQATCKHARPRCDACPLTAECDDYTSRT
jgi:endonuclease III